MVELLRVLLTVTVLIYAIASMVYYYKVRNSEPERKQAVFVHSTIAGTAIALLLVWFWIPSSRASASPKINATTALFNTTTANKSNNS